jgi:Putative quorum-sensing-regulated virulence factor
VGKVRAEAVDYDYGWPRMPFGRHKGRPISALPTGYLCWLTTLEDLKWHLREAVEAELRRRPDAVERDDDGRRRPPPRPPALPPWEPVVRAWQREMTLLFHPDKGGSHEAMQAVNAGADKLRKLFAEATS